jgi:branched-chain amino acid aminotransferase
MIYLNGTLLPPEQARIDPADRGFTLADGLFETLRAYRGRPFKLEAHFARLARSAAELKIPLAIDVAAVADAVAEVLAANRLNDGDAAIRITLTRGTGSRGLAPPAEVKPTLMISATAYRELPDACSAAIVDIRRNEGSPLSRLKSLAYLDNVLAAGEAEQRGADEAILLNNADHVTGAARANLFALIRDILVTPPISDGVLPGITRQTVLDIACDLGVTAEERSMTATELGQVRAILLTNSLFEIRSVTRLADRDLTSSSDVFAGKLRKAYRALVEH